VARDKKNRYRHTTPVTRLRRNVDKIFRHAELCRDRLEVWKRSEDPVVAQGLVVVGLIEQQAKQLDDLVVRLDETGFIPPHRTPPWQPMVGDLVKVASVYLGKYGQLYEKILKEDPDMLMCLVVVKVLTSGEVLVRRGKRTPFVVRKSHIVLVSRTE
jgi:hypothetical protein